MIFTHKGDCNTCWSSLRTIPANTLNLAAQLWPVTDNLPLPNGMAAICRKGNGLQ